MPPQRFLQPWGALHAVLAVEERATCFQLFSPCYEGAVDCSVISFPTQE